MMEATLTGRGAELQIRDSRRRFKKVKTMNGENGQAKFARRKETLREKENKDRHQRSLFNHHILIPLVVINMRPKLAASNNIRRV